MLLEKKFQTGPGTDGLFSTRTPVEFGKGDSEAPPSLPGKVSEKFLDRFRHKLKPIMKVRDVMDKVYSKGYFENHYPKADKTLKKVLHEEAKIAHSRMMTDDDTEEHEDKSVVININIGGLLSKGD